MKNIKVLIALLFTAVLMSGCKDDFFDVNTPSNVISEEQVDIKTQLPYVEVKLADMQFGIAYYAAQYDQQAASYHIGGADIHDRVSMAGAWSRYYTKIMNNLRIIEKKAMEQNNKHYLGIAQVIEALATQMATDQWGDIPYSEAGQGADNLYPHPDSQQDIYAALNTLLDNAIANLQAPGNGAEPGSEDVIYGGDLDKWIRAAYTLKARLAIHMTKRSGAQAAQDALAALQNGFASNDDDFQVYYDETYRNPWFTSVVAARRTGNLSLLLSRQLIDKMNGNDYPFTNITIDPRLPHYADNGGAATYVGAVNGSGGSGPGNVPANADFADDFYFSQSAPIVLMSYQEAKFIEAEAHLILGQTGPAYQAYMDGITASMDKMGIPSADRDAYLAEASVNLNNTSSNIDMEHIMWQKFVALILNPEVWTDMRRYDFDANIFKNLAYPDNRSTDIPAGEWPRRAVYPQSEVSRNPNIQQVQEWWSKLWWDQ